MSDSTRWNGFRYRPDDIVIVTWAKSAARHLTADCAHWLKSGEYPSG